MSMTALRGPGRRRSQASALALAGLAAAGIAFLIEAGCSCAPGSDRAQRLAIRELLRQREGFFRRPATDADGLQALTRRFYRDRGFRPAWTNARGPTGEARDLVAALQAAPREGLDPAVYGLDRLQSWMKRASAGLLGPAPDPRALAALDVSLTRSFLHYAAHLWIGQVDPRQLPADWHLPRQRANLDSTLKQALAEHRVGAALRLLPPRDPRYMGLRKALERYHALAASGGWKPIPRGAPLRRGQRGARVAALRALLAATGDLTAAPRSAPVFDAATEAAVRRFEERHGLRVDGVVGTDDFDQMNVPLKSRIRQIELNMERWRWLPARLGERYLMVNIPDYSLQVIEKGHSILSMRVVVGKQYSTTPMFSDKITYLVFNPYWNVPQSIAVEEILPQVQQDRDYLAKTGIRVFDGPGPDAREIDPRTVDWAWLWPDDFHYFFRQDPGPANPVGHIKFMCPNQFDVYLHDTPAGQLFDAQQRDFSHGCIRVEEPIELAQYLLRGRPGSDRAGIAAALASSRDSSVKLPDPIPIYILYWTAWVDDRGELQFRDDVYGLDQILEQALRGARPVAGAGARPPGAALGSLRRETRGRRIQRVRRRELADRGGGLERLPDRSSVALGAGARPGRPTFRTGRWRRSSRPS